MRFEKIYERLNYNNKLAEKIGFNPYYNEIQSGLDDNIIIKGEKFINLASNNYLGLANDSRIKAAIIETVNKYGASLCGTPVSTGYIDLLKKVDDKLANFLRLDSVIIFPSCYQANNGLFTAIADKKDLIIVDRFAHSSLVQGIMAVGCKVRPFLHNNIEHLREVLAKSTSYNQVFVVTESVFSTDGSISPFKHMVDLCNEFGAIPVIDDSHGIGVIGNTGRGILEKEGIQNYTGIYTTSLGKAFANSGGIIAGDKKLIDYLRYYCPQLVYSTALPPAVLGGIEKVIEIIELEFELIAKRMWRYKDLLYKGLIDAGFEMSVGEAPINSILTGTMENTILVAKKLFDNRILATPFVEPSVSINEGKVRLIAGANLSDETIKKAIHTIKRIGNQ